VEYGKFEYGAVPAYKLPHINSPPITKKETTVKCRTAVKDIYLLLSNYTKKMILKKITPFV
jgi:hypothetical protein